MTKFTICSVLLALVACSVQGSILNDWEARTKALEVKFENLVNSKVQAAQGKVQSAEASLKSDSAAFFKSLEAKINAYVSDAEQSIDILKYEASLDCYKNASVELINAQEAALANLLACKNMSQAYKDIQVIAQHAAVVILDVAKDAKLIIAGVAECEVDVGIAKWECALKYVAEEIQQLVTQWPDVQQFIAITRVLGSQLESEITACVNDPSQQSLEEKVKKALADFSACSQQATQP